METNKAIDCSDGVVDDVNGLVTDAEHGNLLSLVIEAIESGGIYIHPMVPCGDDPSDEEHLKPRVDWSKVIEYLEFGYRLFDASKLQPNDFYGMLNKLKNDYARECINELTTLDDEQLMQALRSYLPDHLDCLESYASVIEDDQCSLLKCDKADRASGRMDENEYRSIYDKRMHIIYHVWRIQEAVKAVRDGLSDNITFKKDDAWRQILNLDLA